MEHFEGQNLTGSTDSTNFLVDESPETNELEELELEGAEETSAAEGGDSSDDPVRVYLREMGSVELLSREGEIAIAKRIEAGREMMIGAHRDSFFGAVVVVGEGLKNAAGEEIGVDKTRVDACGHAVLGGAADRLMELVQGKLNLKTRTVKLGYAQRAAAHFASETDVEEATACGTAAVRAAVSGQSGFMVKIVRTQNNPYRWTTGLQPLADIANVEHFVPRDWVSDDGFSPNEKFVEYARPLVAGELKLPTEGGLPKFATLDKSPVEKKLPARA